MDFLAERPVGAAAGLALALALYYLLKPLKPGCVPVRANWQLRLLNAALIIPCFLVDRFGIKVPKACGSVCRTVCRKLLPRRASSGD